MVLKSNVAINASRIFVIARILDSQIVIKTDNKVYIMNAVFSFQFNHPTTCVSSRDIMPKINVFWDFKSKIYLASILRILAIAQLILPEKFKETDHTISEIIKTCLHQTWMSSS